MNEFLQVIVRPAITEDLDAYVNLAADFHEASPMKGVADFDPPGIRAFLARLLENNDALVLVAELDGEIAGITACLLYPLYFSPNNQVVQELWWWLTPEARGNGVGKKMYQAIELWAKSRNAKAVFMIALEDERAATMEKIYFQAGFRALERTFIKEL